MCLARARHVLDLDDGGAGEGGIVEEAGEVARHLGVAEAEHLQACECVAEGSVSGLVYSVRASALRLVFLSASSSRFLALRIDFWNTARTLLLEPVDGGERSSAELFARTLLLEPVDGGEPSSAELSSASESRSSVPESTEPSDFSLPDSSLPDSSSDSPLEFESEEISGSTSCSSISSSIVWRASLITLSGLTFTVSLNWSTVRVVSA